MLDGLFFIVDTQNVGKKLIYNTPKQNLDNIEILHEEIQFDDKNKLLTCKILQFKSLIYF